MRKFQTYKVRNKFNNDVFYTCDSWLKKKIDGVDFIYVKKNSNDSNVHLMKRDILEKISETKVY